MPRLTNRFIQFVRHAALVWLCSVIVSGIADREVRADCSSDSSFWAAMDQVWVEFSTENKKSLVIAAWMANSPEQRARGFQGVCPGLVVERSLLFSFPVPVYANFHMIGVTVPLDIAFIGVSKQVVSIQRMTQQESNQPIIYYRPKTEIQFALETMAGRLDELWLHPGLWRMQISSRNQWR